MTPWHGNHFPHNDWPFARPVVFQHKGPVIRRLGLNQPLNKFPMIWGARGDTVMVNRYFTLKWRHIERDSVSNHQLRESLLNGLSDADQRNHESLASLAFVRVIHRGPVNSPHKWPVTRKMFPFDDVIMIYPALIAFCIHSKASCGQMIIYWLKKSALVWLSSSWDGECQNIGIIKWNDLAFC